MEKGCNGESRGEVNGLRKGRNMVRKGRFQKGGKGKREVSQW